MFNKFKSLVKKETKDYIGYLCIDRSGEFNLLEFNLFCSDNDISRQLVIAYTPSKIGLQSVRIAQL